MYWTIWIIKFRIKDFSYYITWHKDVYKYGDNKLDNAMSPNKFFQNKLYIYMDYLSNLVKCGQRLQDPLWLEPI